MILIIARGRDVGRAELFRLQRELKERGVDSLAITESMGQGVRIFALQDIPGKSVEEIKVELFRGREGIIERVIRWWKERGATK